MERNDMNIPEMDKLTINDTKDTLLANSAYGEKPTAEACGGNEPASSAKEAIKQKKLISEIAKNYVLVDDEEGLKACLEEVRASVETDPFLALDCEGDDLSRTGQLQLLSLATRSKVFLVDIKTLKAQPFETGLREILEKAEIKKLMFDCREDSDALFHQFNVKLDGVLDVQLLEIIKHQSSYEDEKSRRCDKHDDVVRVKSLLECIETYTKSKWLKSTKRSIAGKLTNWGGRPLQVASLEYAAADSMSLFMLYDELRPEGEDVQRLEIASGVYVDLKRSLASRTFDVYENNAYLPMDVIPARGSTGFGYAYTWCTKCKRQFPREEFSNTQLSKGIQMCRTCKQVKQDLDRKESLRLNYERDEARRSDRELYRMLRGDRSGPRTYSIPATEYSEACDIVWDPADGMLVFDENLGLYYV